MVGENEESKDWVVRLLNLPPKEQIEFLYRHSAEQSLREEIERKLFGDEEEKEEQP